MTDLYVLYIFAIFSNVLKLINLLFFLLILTSGYVMYMQKASDQMHVWIWPNFNNTFEFVLTFA